ncbi:MAG: sialate O-acetylesterase [Saccharofermentanales bacterium]
MPNSVIITKGARDWQIYQQIDGFATIRIEGIRDAEHNPGSKVMARIVDETTQMSVTEWIFADAREDGSFTAEIENIPAGGLYRLETTLSPPAVFDISANTRGDFVFHIGVGDLYVIAGQSNAAGYGRTPIEDPADPMVHLYKNSGRWDMAVHPMNDSTGSIHEANAEYSNSGHSPFLSFAKKMSRYLNYPIGLIQTSLGGSGLDAWNPAKNGILYENMVDIVYDCTGKAGRVAGILWYQGCSDCSSALAATYHERFACFVDSLRKDFHDSELPVYTVQLNKYFGEDNADQHRSWSMIREIQRKAARTIHNVYVIPTMDLALSDLIHNSSSSNMVIGERLANIALSETFKFKVYGKAPDIESAEKIAGNQIRLTFANVYQGIYALGIPARNLQFVVTDDDGDITIKSYTERGDLIDLYLERDAGSNVKVSFAARFDPSPAMPFDSGSGLPLLGFYEFMAKG